MDPRARLVALARLLLIGWALVACHGGRLRDTDADGKDDAPADETDPATQRPDGPSVLCPNPFRPAKSLTCADDTPVCCLGGALGVTPRCVDDVEACGQDSRLACDDAWDCPDAEVCCVAQTSGGSGQKLVGTCAAKCNLFQKRVCSGTDASCGGEGQTCCFEDGDTLGRCVPEGRSCPVDTAASARVTGP